MELDIALQALIREETMKSIEVDKIEHLVLERDMLISELDKNVEKVIADKNLYVNAYQQRIMVENIADEILGFGPLREFIEDDTVSDILVNGPEAIFIERRGLLEKTNRRFIDNTQLTDIAKRLVLQVGRRIDEGRPLVDSRLPDGSRLNVVIQPIALEGTSISIRKFSKNNKSLADLVGFGAMSNEMANFLIIAARCRVNIIISGGTGSGKTTLLNALSQYISENERILTLEDAAELRLMQPHVVRLETRLAGVENTGQITMRDLVINSLRMRPDRIIVGECRGEETFEMLQAMNTGHDGSMSTLHANSPRDAVARLESMVMMSGMSMPLTAIRRNIASAVNLIVQVSRLNDGSRKIMNITEIMGIEGDNVVLQDIFTFHNKQTRSEEGFVEGEFKNHGLLMRSAIMTNAYMFNLGSELKQMFGMTS
ncbi:CpaF family protein [Pragia fontium]|uniref:Pilus assembly protein CpaF n=2 Tax=Pragia fontium TaxID=82985 RepID=A0AAJ4W8A2_9GAMM|nr:CpaF family protein [Pragia fontium]AKJ41123.1 pilus assembly protein CpaF [Pragia fontium]SFC13631.1 pilus assembly protein CpaF [Pragia fontium DSM 5563 = ATCC 49100]SUB81323.1 Type IV secretion system protein virB11 [Pragia fontium]VEJ53500.1 Type IV secretion system protein virB11 [Pragia fontium]GKX63308.1 tight adherance operon protein [Pragia fontium]